MHDSLTLFYILYLALLLNSFPKNFLVFFFSVDIWNHEFLYIFKFIEEKQNDFLKLILYFVVVVWILLKKRVFWIFKSRSPIKVKCLFLIFDTFQPTVHCEIFNFYLLRTKNPQLIFFVTNGSWNNLPKMATDADEAQRRREECERKARRGEMDPRLEFTFQLLIDATQLPRHQLMDYIFEGDMVCNSWPRLLNFFL